MTDQSPSNSGHWEPGVKESRLERTSLSRLENLVVTLALCAMILLPLFEAILRPTFHVGISASSALVQHLTLIIGMLGGAIAARENRLLSLATGSMFLKGRPKQYAVLLSGAFAATVTFFLCVASIQFIETEREGGNILAYGLPVWVIQLVLPIGFGLVGLRLALSFGRKLEGPNCRHTHIGHFLLLGLATADCSFKTGHSGAGGIASLDCFRCAGLRHLGWSGINPFLGR